MIFHRYAKITLFGICILLIEVMLFAYTDVEMEAFCEWIRRVRDKNRTLVLMDIEKFSYCFEWRYLGRCYCYDLGTMFLAFIRRSVFIYWLYTFLFIPIL